MRREKQAPARVPLGAFIDRDHRQELTKIARGHRSVSSIVRLALFDYLGREHEEVATPVGTPGRATETSTLG